MRGGGENELIKIVALVILSKGNWSERIYELYSAMCKLPGGIYIYICLTASLVALGQKSMAGAVCVVSH